MADNFKSNIAALFDGMDAFTSSKTVIGEPIKVDDATIIPLIDVSCGLAAGSFGKNAADNGAGGMGIKMTPSAVLVIQNGASKVINIKNQDAASKVMDMVPDILNKIKRGDKHVTPKAQAAAERIAAEQSERYEN